MSVATTTCRSCDASIARDATFCSSCGAKQDVAGPARGTRDITYATAPLPRNAVDDLLDSGDEHRAELANWHRRHSHPALVLGAVIVSVVLATVAAGVALGVRAATTDPGPSQAERQAAALHSLQADLNPQLAAFMNARTSFFAAERRYLAAMKRARAEISDYKQALRTQWQPPPPDVDGQVDDLRSVASDMTSLQAGLVGLSPVASLAPTYKQLLSAIQALGSDATDNARTLTEGIGSSINGTRIVDVATLGELSGNEALPSIRQMNRSLVGVLDAAHLPLADYDVPAGTDLDPDDDSTTL